MNSRPLSNIIFKLKNDSFKTRDFSPLIERVPAGVYKDTRGKRLKNSKIWKIFNLEKKLVTQGGNK